MKRYSKRIFSSFLIMVLILITTNQSVEGCDCLWQGSFFTVAPKCDLVISGKIIRYDLFKNYSIDRKDTLFPVVMDVEIIDVFKPMYLQKRMGKSHVVKILGNVTNSCAPDVTEFKIGSEWVFALFNNNGNKSLFDFSLSNCGSYYLPINENYVCGNIVGENQKFESDGVNIKMRYENFKKELK
jgi:hypothetical protein